MSTDPQMTALRLVLAAFYAAGMAAVWRRADVWYPFTPTLTATAGKWVGWRDAFRWLLSVVFFVLLPALYFLYVQIALARQSTPLMVQFTPPSGRDLIKFVVIMSLIAPPLGFYDLWQAIMRALPDLFYSSEAKRKIKSVYPSAFDAGHGATIAWGLLWIFVPIGMFVVLLAWP